MRYLVLLLLLGCESPTYHEDECIELINQFGVARIIDRDSYTSKGYVYTARAVGKGGLVFHVYESEFVFVNAQRCADLEKL